MTRKTQIPGIGNGGAAGAEVVRIRTSQARRLREARICAGYRTAREFTDKCGLTYVTYTMHEAGSVGIKPRAAANYAAALKNCSAEWIITGQGLGPSKPGPQGDEVRREVPRDGDNPAGSIPVPRFPELPRDVPVFGTAAGSMGKGAFIIHTADPLDWTTRHPGIANRRAVYALYIENDSMEPRYLAGEKVYVDPQRPARSGDFVVIQIKTAEHQPPVAYIKRLVSRSDDWLVVEQFNPKSEIKFKMATVVAVHRVLYTHEL